jgi:hypothetical protein
MSECTHEVREVKVRTRRTVRRGDQETTVEKVRVKRTKRTTRTAGAKPNGVILYRGPSKLNGKPIVVVATGLARRSKNPKTGNEIQTYVLPDEGLDPIQAAAVGGEASVCGDCVHRPRQLPDGSYKLGSCYVNLIFGPLEVWKKLKDGRYPTFNRAEHLWLFKARVLRLGSYGDPAAVPLKIWRMLCRAAQHWTGYTHAWRSCNQALRQFCMASVETANQAREAWAKGWRTFRVRLEGQPVEQGEFVCPASKEGGRRKTCEECRACSGNKAGGRNVSPVVIFHGSEIAGAWKRRLYEQTLDRLHAEEAGRLSLPVVAN